MSQFKQEISNTPELNHERSNQEGLSKMIEQLIKPEQLNESIDKHLLQKKPRKKRRQSHHL